MSKRYNTKPVRPEPRSGPRARSTRKQGYCYTYIVTPILLFFNLHETNFLIFPLTFFCVFLSLFRIFHYQYLFV